MADIIPIRPTVLSFVVCDGSDKPEIEGVRGYYCRRHAVQGFDLSGKGCPRCLNEFRERCAGLFREIMEAEHAAKVRLLEVYEVDGQTCLAIDGVEVLRLPPRE